MRTTTHEHGTGSATVNLRGYGVEVDLFIEKSHRGGVIGGIPDRAASTHSLMYRNAPCAGADAPDVAASALVNGF